MNEQMILDIGMHKAEDTTFYLRQNYKVIAVDADPGLIKSAAGMFRDDVASGKLLLLNFAISDKDDDTVEFYLGKKTVWNSLKAEVTDRAGNMSGRVAVGTKKLSTLVREYGVPLYCKIDIEGYDGIAASSLSELETLPEYISLETECLGENESVTADSPLATLNTLKGLGYNKFKLIDQVSLTVLEEGKRFYTDSILFLYKLFAKLKLPFGNRRRLEKKFNYRFPEGATGPFGKDLDGHWMSYDEAARTLLKHRKDYFKLRLANNYGFWCDWHAKKD